MAQIERWEAAETQTSRQAEHATVLNPVEARGGVISGRIILLLGASLTLVVLAFVIVYAVQV